PLRFHPHHDCHHRRRAGGDGVRRESLPHPVSHRRVAFHRHVPRQHDRRPRHPSAQSQTGGQSLMPPKPPPPKPGFQTELRRRRRWKLLIAKQETIPWSFQSTTWGLDSKFFTGLTGFATFLILSMLAVILGDILIKGWPGLSWHLISSGTDKDMFDVDKAGVLPMIIGTAARVILMTLFVIPIGVITAVYLTEYAHAACIFNRIIRGAVNNLAGVPSIVFGLFGLGFFINFVGGRMDQLFRPGAAEPLWG